MKSVLKFLSGSFATYVLMAACSSAKAPSAARTVGAGAGDATGGALAMGGAPGTTPDGAGGASAQQSGSGGSMMVAITDPVPDASAEPATDGTRLKAIFQVGDDGSRQQQYNWWDSSRSEECSFTSFDDGSTRCVPQAGATVGSFFSESGCINPLFASSTSTCVAAAKYSLGVAHFTSCSTVAYDAIYALTSATPAQVYQGKPGACTMVPGTSLMSYAFYTGTPIPLTTFVAATKQHG